MRGGGTSQAGQAIGAGLVVDTSKYFNRLIEVNPEARWVRVEPGIVLDELNAALAVHRLRFAPDISTASRATVGGMMANNSAGARSVMYGKTIDHVLEMQVLLSDGTFAWFRPVAGGDLDSICEGTSLESSCYRVVRRLARDCADEIECRYPKILRRVGGYNLDEFVRPDRPFNLAKLLVGAEGCPDLQVEAGHRLEVLLCLCPLGGPLELVGEGQPERVAGQGGGDRDERGHALGTLEREVDRDPAAAREADERSFVEPGVVEHRAEVVDQRIRPVRAR